MKKIVTLLCFLSLINSLYCVNPLAELFVGREWEFIEDQFITQPQNKLQSISQQLKRVLPAIATAIIAGYSTDILLQRVVKDTKNFEWQSCARTFIDPTTSVATLYITYKLLTNYYQQEIELAHLKNFIRAWSTNKQYTPTQFHATFDLIYAQTNVSGFNNVYEEQAPELIRLTKNTIYQHFPTKYEHQLKDANAPVHQYSFWHTIVTLDIGDVIRAIAKIFSSFSSKND